MEKTIQPYDKERMRMAMLKHEETFRQQVYELHRLYKIQKLLMDQQQQQQQDQQDENELELTLSLGPSSTTRRKPDKNSESGQSSTTVSSSSTGSTQTRKNSPNYKDHVHSREDKDAQFITWGAAAGDAFLAGPGSGNSVPGSGPGFMSGRQSGGHPAWLFQALSLKMT